MEITSKYLVLIKENFCLFDKKLPLRLLKTRIDGVKSVEKRR